MLIGPTSTKQEISDYRKRLLANPAGFIAQPTISLSTNPTAVSDGIAPRHIDLRPFILSHGDGSVDIVPGGLTRVAMVEGSLVVNSSQGGGIKDTWVIDDSDLAASTKPSVAKKQDHQIDKQSSEAITANHSYYHDPVQPLEAGYENPDNAPMILLLSTANYLVWLGRYSERLYYYDNIIKQLVKGNIKKAQLP